MKSLFVLLFLLLSPVFVFSQTEERKPEDFDTVMTLTDFWETVFKEDTVDVSLQSVYVKNDSLFSPEVTTVRNFLKKKKVINHKIYLFNIHFQNFSTSGGGYSSISIDSTHFKKEFKLVSTGLPYVRLKNITSDISFKITLATSWSRIEIDQCEFSTGFDIYGAKEKDSHSSLRMTNTTIRGSILYGNFCEHISGFTSMYFNNCKFQKLNDIGTNQGLYFKNEELKRLEISNSNFETPLFIQAYNTPEELIINNSKISSFGINKLRLPENEYDIHIKWNELTNGIHYVSMQQVKDTSSWNGTNTSYTFYGFDSDSSIIKSLVYDELKSNAYQLLNIYKAQGDIESYNACYADIKKFENRRWKYLYQTEPTFEKWFRWRLNELISAYSDYGTNPAKAVIKSFWVILIFTIFYMFFPSEWDISSKAAILANFKRVRDKNDQTASPILKALAFLLVSFANAFTLSINSFVTLGFGHIPTKGVARYFTILQGFIGWFLLTIFSVSLISQVLN